MCQACSCGRSNAACRYGNAKARSKSVSRAQSSLCKPGFPDLDLFDQLVLTVRCPPHIKPTTRASCARGRNRKVLLSRHHCPDGAGGLVCQRDGHQHARLSRKHFGEPRAFRCSIFQSPADPRHGADDQQASDVALPHLRGSPQDLSPTGGSLKRDESQPCGEVPPAFEPLHRRGEGFDRHRADWSDPWRGLQPDGLRVAASLVTQAPFDNSNSLVAGLKLVKVQTCQLDDEWRQANVWIFGLLSKRFYEGSARGCANAVLHQMSSERIDDLVPLPDEQVSCLEHHRPGLLFSGLYRHKAHSRSQGGLSNGLGIRCIILLSLHERLHVNRRDEANLVADSLKLTSPIMRRRASLHGNTSWGVLLHECTELGS